MPPSKLAMIPFSVALGACHSHIHLHMDPVHSVNVGLRLDLKRVMHANVTLLAGNGSEMAELEISALSVGEGTLAIASLPGRGGDLKGDLTRFGEFKPSLVLTMVTDAELEDVGASQFGYDVQGLGCRWAHLPVVDYGVPSDEALARWVEVSAMARAALKGGGRVIVHCKGGCGRSGMAALRLMIETGEAPDAALKRLRAVRPCAVETADQFNWALEASSAP